MIPQLIYLVLVLLGMGYDIARHGEEKKPGKENAWSSLVARIILVLLLYWGGFFDVFHVI